MEAFQQTENCALEGFVIAGRRLDRLPVAEVGKDREGRDGATNKCGCCVLESVSRRPSPVPQGSTGKAAYITC